MGFVSCTRGAGRQRAPHVRVVFDRFHVQGLVHDALDQIRRGMVAELREPDEKRALKGTRYALQRSPWRLDAVARRKLDELEKGPPRRSPSTSTGSSLTSRSA